VTRENTNDHESSAATGFGFYLGTHMPNWLETAHVPLFVSRRRLADRRTLPTTAAPWALDSGGFTELSLYGRWETQPLEYVRDVRRFEAEIGLLEWAAPQDWMCEPFMLTKTGLSVEEHQRRTVDNFLHLRQLLGPLVVPVLQGWDRDDYLRCCEMYVRADVDLADEPLVGLGSVCRRQNTAEAGRIVRSLAPLRLHYFGAKMTGLESFSDALASADSMAWSYAARREAPLPGCSHKSCANCFRYAMRWRTRLMTRLDQQRLEVAA
jgi:hypothetical protein